MRKGRFAFSVALCLGGAIIGCNSKSTSEPIKVNPAPAAPALSGALTLQTKCSEEAELEGCVGGYGFTVDQDGKYTLGPGPNGEKRRGELSTEDASKVKEAITALSQVATFGEESHEAVEAADEDTVTFTQTGNSSTALAPVVLLKTSGADLSFRTTSAVDAKNLLSLLRGLAGTYYTLPFPDACGDGVAPVNELFAEMQSCTTDQDCSYLDGAFGLIENSSTQYVVEDDCNIVKPLIVGNAKKVESSREKLEESYTTIRNACGYQFFKPDCTQVTGFYLQGSAPVCQQGVCKISSAR